MCHGLRGRVDKVAHLAFRPPQLGKVNVSIGNVLPHCVVQSEDHCRKLQCPIASSVFRPPSKPLAHSKSSVKTSTAFFLALLWSLFIVLPTGIQRISPSTKTEQKASGCFACLISTGLRRFCSLLLQSKHVAQCIQSDIHDLEALVP